MSYSGIIVSNSWDKWCVFSYFYIVSKSLRSIFHFYIIIDVYPTKKTIRSYSIFKFFGLTTINGSHLLIWIWRFSLEIAVLYFVFIFDWGSFLFLCILTSKKALHISTLISYLVWPKYAMLWFPESNWS